MTPRLVQASCPKCGASLSIAAGALQVNCTYCGTTVFVVPPKRATGAFVHPPQGQPTIQLNNSQWERLGGAIALGTIWFTFAIFAVVGLSVAGLVAYIVYKVHSTVEEARRSIENLPKIGDDDGDPKTKTKKTKPPVHYDFATLDGCSCRVKLDGKQVYAALSGALSGPSNDDLTATFTLTAAKDLSLDVGDDTAPPAKVSGTTLGLAVGCSGDVFAVVAGSNATGWSAQTGKRLWTKKLPAPYIHPTKPPKSGFTIGCAHAEAETIRFPTENGDASVRVKDGLVGK